MVSTPLLKSLKNYTQTYKVETKSINTDNNPKKSLIQKLPKGIIGLKKAKLLKRYQHSEAYLKQSNKKETLGLKEKLATIQKEEQDYLQKNIETLKSWKLPEGKRFKKIKDEVVNFEKNHKKKIMVLKKKGNKIN